MASQPQRQGRTAAGGDDGALGGGSLFEGMVLFDPSSSSSIPLSPPSSPPPPPDADADAAAEVRPPSPPLSSTPAAASSSSHPLDEDLFSNLTLQTPPPPALLLQATLPPPLPSPSEQPPLVPSPDPITVTAGAATPETPPLLPPARQISRKKKRAVRIGYAREPVVLGFSAPTEDEGEPSPSPPPGHPQGHRHHGDSPSAASLFPSPLVLSDSTPPSPALFPSVGAATVTKSAEEEESRELGDQARGGMEDGIHRDGGLSRIPDEDAVDLRPAGEEEEKSTMPPSKEGEEDACASIEERLERIRARISEKLDQISEMAAALSKGRKELGRRRRKAADSVNSASTRYKELEMELEEACEAEDFERAERVSESLAAAEKEKDELLAVLRGAEEDCDTMNSKMQEVLQMQISAEEESVALLEQFAKDAADNAELVMKNAVAISSKEMEEWQLLNEALEIKKLEMDIQSHVIDEARSGLENSIEHLIEDDQKEKEMLSQKGGMLSMELDELLVLVRMKEAEIAENDAQIQEVDKRIHKVVFEYQDTQSTIGSQYSDLQLALSRMESEGEALFVRKKGIDESLTQAEQKSSKLRELAHVSAEEARTCHDLVVLRKNLASSILKSREDKVRLAKKEEKISEEIQILRQQITSARASLQELSSTRASIQQEIASFKQRISFIDKRGPELEAEKKVAAAARNFKEAGRIAAEAKTLSSEKESIQIKKEKAVLDLEKVEEEIRNIIDKIQENEGLILSKGKEAAMAGCEKLCLIAAAARAERSAALESDDSEEVDILLTEAEAAESKARELQQTYNLESDVLKNIPEHLMSIPLITSLGGKHLADMAASFNLPSASS